MFESNQKDQAVSNGQKRMQQLEIIEIVTDANHECCDEVYRQ